MGVSRKRRIFALGGAGVVMAGAMIGAVGLTALPAGAVNNDPAGNPSSPAVSYEADCGGSGLAAGQTVPFISSTVIDTTTGATAVNATGATFGVAGAVTQTLSGALVAGLNAALDPAQVGLSVNETFGSTDGTATGSSAYAHTFANVANPGGQVLNVTYTTGSTTLDGAFPAGAAGDFVANSQLGGTGITAGTVITAVNPGVSATIDQPTTAAEAAGVTVGYTPEAGISFTDASFATAANAFTTSGPEGGKSSIGITSVTSYTMTTSSLAAPTLGFGGTAGTAAGDCTETGWVTATSHAPGNAGAGGVPLLPFGATTPIVAATPTFTAGAYANLIEPLPVANNQAVNLGVGGTKTVVLSTAAGNPLYPVTSCAAGTPSNPRLTVTITNTPTPCSATLTDSGSGVGSVTFTFTASDGFPNTSAPGTVTVTIGTPPVDQPLQEDISGGQLVLSCVAPPAAASTSCPLITLPAITLNGTQQTSTAAANTIYVSDNRGDPTVGWTVTSYLVPTATNPNAGCDTLAQFCNSNASADAALATNNIVPSNFAISGVACAAMAGTVNPAPAAGAGGTYASTQTLCTANAGTGGGSFTVNGNFTLTIPSSTAAGLYQGTIEYLVA